MKKLILIITMLTVLTGWTLEESLQDVGEGIRTGVKNAEQAFKDAPAAISEAGNKVEADIKKEDNESEDGEKKDHEKRD